MKRSFIVTQSRFALARGWWLDGLRLPVAERGGKRPIPKISKTTPCKVARGADDACWLRLLHEFRFQVHRADAVDLAGDVVAIGRLGQADVPDLGAAFDDR